MPYLPVALVDSMTSESVASLLHVIFCCILPPYTMFGGLFYIDKVSTIEIIHCKPRFSLGIG